MYAKHINVHAVNLSYLIAFHDAFSVTTHSISKSMQFLFDHICCSKVCWRFSRNFEPIVVIMINLSNRCRVLRSMWCRHFHVDIFHWPKQTSVLCQYIMTRVRMPLLSLYNHHVLYVLFPSPSCSGHILSHDSSFCDILDIHVKLKFVRVFRKL